VWAVKHQVVVVPSLRNPQQDPRLRGDLATSSSSTEWAHNTSESMIANLDEDEADQGFGIKVSAARPTTVLKQKGGALENRDEGWPIPELWPIADARFHAQRIEKYGSITSCTSST
jgi:hypothetical protein